MTTRQVTFQSLRSGQECANLSFHIVSCASRRQQLKGRGSPRSRLGISSYQLISRHVLCRKTSNSQSLEFVHPLPCVVFAARSPRDGRTHGPHGRGRRLSSPEVCQVGEVAETEVLDEPLGVDVGRTPNTGTITKDIMEDTKEDSSTCTPAETSSRFCSTHRSDFISSGRTASMS